MKVALNEIGPWTFRGVSLFFAAVVLLVVTLLTGQSLKVPRRDIVPLLLVAVFATTGWQLLSAYGVSLMRPGRAVILGFTMPLWAMILSLFVLKETITPARLLGLVLGLAGMGVLIGPDVIQLRTAPLGPTIMIVAAFSWATGIVLTKYFRWTLSTLSLAAWQLFLGSIPIVVGAFVFESPFSDLVDASLSAVIAILFMVFIANSFCIYAWFKFIRLFPAQVVAIGILLVPVVGVLSSTVIVGDPVVARDLAALVLVVASLGLVMAAIPIAEMAKPPDDAKR